MSVQPSRVVGRAFAAAFAVILLVRRPRPIHPRGIVLQGQLVRRGGAAPSGIAWIDDRTAGPVHVVARLSRSAGLPVPLPDVFGLALRFDAGGRSADIELASTGARGNTRFLLVPRLFPSRARLGTLLPYRSSRGPVLLMARTLSPAHLPAGGNALDAALALEPWVLRLYHSGPTGPWHPFAELALSRAASQDDDGLRFDAVEHAVPGAETYPWVRQARQPSYELARRSGSRAERESAAGP